MQHRIFEAIFRASSLPTLLLKPDQDRFLIVDVNPAYLEITGTSPQELLGRSTSEAFPKNPSLDFYGDDILSISLQKVVRTKEKDTMDILRYDIPVRGTDTFLEKYWSIENAPVLNPQGELEYIINMVKDVTAQVVSEKEEKTLRSKTGFDLQQFRHFVDANPEGLYSMDCEGNFLNVNQGLADIAELPRERMLEMSFLPFCSEKDRDYILEHFHRALSGESSRFEAEFVSARGRELYLDISLAPIKKGEQIIGAYGIARDLTSLRQSEKVVMTKKNYLKANAVFLNTLLQNDLDHDSLQGSLSRIGEALDLDRIYFFKRKLNSPGSDLFLHTEWVREHIKARYENPEFQHFPLSRIEQLIGKPRRGVPYMANACEMPDSEFRSMLLAQNIRAILILPVFLDDELFGLIGLNDCRFPREWTEEELSFLKTLASTLTTTFEKRKAKAALLEQEKALRLSEQKFKALVQESGDMIAILDLEANYKFVSESTRHLLGTSPDLYIGRNAMEFIHPEDQKAIKEQYSSLAVNRQFKLPPYRFKDHLGEWRWLETTLTNLMEDPAVEGIVANSRDVSTLLAQEREIRQINERFQMAASATRDLMYDWDPKTNKVVRFHRGLSHFLGHSISAVDQQDFWINHVHPEEVEALEREEALALEDKDRHHIQSEYRFRRADGSYAFLIDRAFIIRDPQGTPTRMVGATSDISELRASMEALQFANKRFKLVMKATNEVIWDWNVLTGRVTRGDSFSRISGFDPEKSTRKINFWFSRTHPEDREQVQQSLFAAIRDPKVQKWRQEYRLITASGEVAYIIDRGFIVRNASGEAIRVVGSALDATESKKTLKRIEEQNSLLREIAWDQSHLVRAPLARLKGLLDLLAINETTVLSQEETLELMVESYTELDQIIRTIINKSEKVEKS